MEMGLGLCPETCLKNVSVKESWHSPIFRSYLLPKPIHGTRDRPPIPTSPCFSRTSQLLTHHCLAPVACQKLEGQFYYILRLIHEYQPDAILNGGIPVSPKNDRSNPKKGKWWRCWCQGLNKEPHVFFHQQSISFWTSFCGYALGDRYGHEL